MVAKIISESSIILHIKERKEREIIKNLTKGIVHHHSSQNCGKGI